MKKYFIIFLLLFIPTISYGASEIDSYTKLLLHGEGTDASTTITDNSGTGKTITVVNNSQIDTAQKKWQTASILFDGTTDYIYSDASADYTVGTADFTIDYWWRVATTAIAGAFQQSPTANGLQASTTDTLAVGSDAGAVWRLYGKNTATNSTATYSINTWYHMALVSNGTTLTLYANGTAVITVLGDSTNYTGNYITLGCFYNTTYCMNGWIDEFRFSKGIARWTTAFTPPTQNYGIPVLTSFTPLIGEELDQVDFVGTDFMSVGTISISGTPLTGYQISSDTDMHGHIPADAVSGYFTYETVHGSATSSLQFTVSATTATDMTETNNKLGYLIALFTFIMVFAVFDFLRRIFIKTT